MLYLGKFDNFKIILRGKPIQQFHIADELKFPKVISYRPQVSAPLKDVSCFHEEKYLRISSPLLMPTLIFYHGHIKCLLIIIFWLMVPQPSLRKWFTVQDVDRQRVLLACYWSENGKILLHVFCELYLHVENPLMSFLFSFFKKNNKLLEFSVP